AYDNAGNVSPPSTTPVCATTGAPERVTFVSGGGWFSCAILSDQTVRCWGANNTWQLGFVGFDTPWPRANGATSAVELAAGYEFICSLHSDDSIRCWGNNANGEYGNGQTSINPYATLTGRTGSDLPHTLGH